MGFPDVTRIVHHTKVPAEIGTMTTKDKPDGDIVIVPEKHKGHLGSTGIGLACAAISCYGAQPFYKTGILIGIVTILAYKLAGDHPKLSVKLSLRALLAWCCLIILFRIATLEPSADYLPGFPSQW